VQELFGRELRSHLLGKELGVIPRKGAQRERGRAVRRHTPWLITPQLAHLEFALESSWAGKSTFPLSHCSELVAEHSRGTPACTPAEASGQQQENSGDKHSGAADISQKDCN